MNISDNILSLVRFFDDKLNIKRGIFILFLFHLLNISEANAQVVANFQASDSTGCNSLVVNFTNQSTGNNLSYFWDFGNGKTSTLEAPQAVYNSTGSYSVKLIVTDGSETDTLLKNNYITIFESPIAEFKTNSPKQGCQPLTVNFENQSTGPAPFSKIIWDFGNGQSSNVANPEYTYTTDGSYTVSLYVEDTNGCGSNATIPDYISVYPRSKAAFTSSQTVSCNDTLTVNFKSQSTGNSPFTYSWHFGDGQSALTENPTHFYEGYGKYNVKLKITDSNGCTDSLIKSNYTELQNIKAAFSLNKTVFCRYEQLQLSNSTTGADSYQWDFGDESYSTIKIPEKHYADTGDFMITLTAGYKGVCFDTTSTTIYIDAVEAAFEADTHYICQLPATVNYTNLSKNSTSYIWKFGNGAQLTNEHPTIDIEKSAENLSNPVFHLTDTLIAQSINGCSDTAIIKNNIYVNVPTVYFTPNDSSTYQNLISGCIPVEVNFQNQSFTNNPDDTLVSRLWTLNQDITSTINNPVHAYDTTGVYPVTLQVTNESGCVNTYSILVEAGTVQNAAFSYTGPDTICGSTKVSFTDVSTDAQLIDKWRWEFSDGTAEEARNPLVQFTDTGSISAHLTVFYNGCMGTTAEAEEVLFVKGPAGGFGFTLNCNDPYRYTFENQLKGVESWYWDFGDGATDSTQQEIIEHLYSASGNYEVTLSSMNSNTNCLLDVNKTIRARNVSADFTVSSLVNCLYDSITFNPAPSIDEAFFGYDNRLVKYLWSFDDTTGFISSNNQISYIFDTPGDHVVGLKVYDVNGCSDVISKTLHTNKINAAFSLDKYQGCAPLEVKLNNTSTADTAISEYIWKAGDKILSTDSSPTITFNEQLKTKINLIITDAIGCKDSLEGQQELTILKPYVDFRALTPSHCFGDSVFFEADSLESIINYAWDFGDNNTLESQFTRHLYADTGKFNLSLTLTDSLGCDSTLSKINYIYVQPLPNPGFTSNNTTSSCYPSITGFNDTTSYPPISQWFWDFGDGRQLAGNPAPFHTYNKSGVFDVSLTVKTNLGCIDSVTYSDFINIGGPYAEIVAPDSFCVNLPAEISMNNENNLLSFRWLTDDGNEYSTSSFQKTWITPGTKNIYLSLKSDTLGTCDKLLTDSVIIPLLNADFSFSPNQGCYPLDVAFIDASAGAINWTYSANQSVIGSDKNFNYVFYTTGINEVKLLVNNNIGCKDSVYKNLEVFPLPHPALNADTLICQGDTITLSAHNGEQYIWKRQNAVVDSLNSSVRVAPDSTQKYSVIVTDSKQCSNSDSIWVTVQPQPKASINTADTNNVIIGEKLILEASQQFADNYFWSPYEFIDCENCLATTAIPEKDMVYTFNAKDANGCFWVKDSVFVFVDAKYSLALPDAFTPNNDGINDKIFVKGWGIKELRSFRVFDTRGRLVFETENLETGWDGYSPEGKEPSGMYFYRVEILSYDNKIRMVDGYFYMNY